MKLFCRKERLHILVLSPQHFLPPVSCPLLISFCLCKVICTTASHSFLVMFSFYSYDNLN